MKVIIKAILTGLIAFSPIAAFGHSPIQTVDSVDVPKFLGTWYQIARNPVIFEAGCVCSRQVLTARPDGKVNVHNTCNLFKANGRSTGIDGIAQSVDPQSNSKFAINFGLPWRGDYWIVAVAEDYSWAVVTDRHQYSLYILSKTPTMRPESYTQAISQAATQVNTSHLSFTLQNECTYPE